MPNTTGETRRRVPVSRVPLEDFFRQQRATKPRHKVLPAWMIANALLSGDKNLAKLARPVFDRAKGAIRKEVRELTGIDF